jgi:hypothetical protein
MTNGEADDLVEGSVRYLMSRGFSSVVILATHEKSQDTEVTTIKSDGNYSSVRGLISIAQQWVAEVWTNTEYDEE